MQVTGTGTGGGTGGGAGGGTGGGAGGGTGRTSGEGRLTGFQLWSSREVSELSKHL